jgi:hypothetical protein
MKKITRTSAAGRPGHYHIIYLNDDETDAAIGATSDPVNSRALPHTHPVTYDPPRPPVEPVEAVPPQMDPTTGQPAMIQDPNTGEMIPDPGTPATPGDPGKEEGEWIIGPAEDGHTHEVSEYAVKQKKSREKDSDVIADCLSLYKASMERTQKSRKKAKESRDFYKGEQWDVKTKQLLDSLDRASLSINEIAKNMDELFGFQIEQRTDLKYLPQEGGDQTVADIITHVVKIILDSCYYGREESKVFRDVATGGFGDWLLYMDFNVDIRGDIKVERFQPDNIHYGPHEKEDLSDCEYEIRERMYSKAKLKQLYPQKAGDIEDSFSNYLKPRESDETIGGGTNTDYRQSVPVGSDITIDGTTPLVDIGKKELRLIQCTQKVYEPVSVIFSTEQSFFFTAFGWDDKDIAAAKTIPGFDFISQIKTRFRITKFCGSVVLSDENPADLPVQDFFTVPVYCYRMDDDYWGKVEVAKDPQREINKRRSQIIDILNRMTNYNFFFTDQTFADGELPKFRKSATQPGAMFQLNVGEAPPTQTTGVPFPAELVQMMQQDQEALARLMNITVQQGGANESGALFQEKQKQRMTGNGFLFDNFSFGKQRLGKLLIPLIQRYYDADRIVRMLNAKNSRQKIKLGGQLFDQYKREDIIQLLETSDLSLYDVVVSESAFSATMRIAIGKIITELIQAGAQLPPEMAFEFIDAPQEIKDRITASVQSQNEANAKTATDSANSEIIKTLIAKGQYTVDTSKAQELGLVPVGQASQPLDTPQNPVNNDQNQGDLLTAQAGGALAG